jgi:predicted PurR-regulated permease PerM
MARYGADMRRLSHVVVTLVAAVFALDMAAKFFIPLLLGIVVTYTLNPAVIWLERRRVHRWLGASAVMFLLVVGTGYIAVSIKGQVDTILTQLPDASHRLHDLVGVASPDEPGMLQRLQQLEQDLQQQATPAPVPGAAPAVKGRAPMHVVVDDPSLHWSSLMWQSSLSVVGVLGQLLMVLFLVYFLLLSGDSFKRKLLRLTGPSLSRKKITLHILDEINVSIQRYMLALFVSNVLLGLLTWGLFSWAGLQNAAAWAVAAALLHIIPYFGSVLTAALTAGAALLQTGSWSMVLLTSGGSLMIAMVVGILISTWMTGRITRMNSAAIFVSLLFWSWLWGVWGALLAVPITGMIKVVCLHVEQFEALGEMLSE